MIEFNYETNFTLKNETIIDNWIQKCIQEDGFKVGEINYVFCDDAYLHKLNVEFLNHDTLTDIISFDTTLGKIIGGDIFISVDRVRENSVIFNSSFDQELYRVMIHGVLHYMGLKDSSEDDKKEMRNKENACLVELNN